MLQYLGFTMFNAPFIYLDLKDVKAMKFVVPALPTLTMAVTIELKDRLRRTGYRDYT